MWEKGFRRNICLTELRITFRGILGEWRKLRGFHYKLFKTSYFYEHWEYTNLIKRKPRHRLIWFIGILKYNSTIFPAPCMSLLWQELCLWYEILTKDIYQIYIIFQIKRIVPSNEIICYVESNNIAKLHSIVLINGQSRKYLACIWYRR